MTHGLRINGKPVSRKEFFSKTLDDGGIDLGLNGGTQAYSEARPWKTESAGVLPHQVQEARRIIKERGLVGITVLDSGVIECTSRGKRGVSGRNGLLDMRGKHDEDGGYGDV